MAAAPRTHRTAVHPAASSGGPAATQVRVLGAVGAAGAVFAFAVAAAATVYALSEPAPAAHAAPSPAPVGHPALVGLPQPLVRRVDPDGITPIATPGSHGIRVWRARAAAGPGVCHIVRDRSGAGERDRVDCATRREYDLNGVTLAGRRTPAGFRGYAVLAADVRRLEVDGRAVPIARRVAIIRARPGDRHLVAHASRRLIRADLARVGTRTG